MKNTKISRRSFLLGLAACSAAGVLTACSGSSEPASSASTAPEPPASSAASEVTAAPFLTVEDFPALDGSTACIPLMAQMKADVTGMDLLEAQTSITVSTTAYAWENFGLWSRSDSDDYGAQLLIVYEAPEYVKEELAEAGAKLEQKAIGRDALVFIVNESNPVQSLTQQQLRDIYAGRITNWKEVGGDDASIVVLTRKAGSGTRAPFQGAVFGDEAVDFKGDAELDKSGDVQTQMGSTDNAISYLDFSHFDDSKFNAIKVEGVEPKSANVTDDSFKIWATEHMYCAKDADEATKAFLEFMLSDDVQGKLVEEQGFIPVSAMKVVKDASGKVSAK